MAIHRFTIWANPNEVFSPKAFQHEVGRVIDFTCYGVKLGAVKILEAKVSDTGNYILFKVELTENIETLANGEQDDTQTHD